MKFAPAAPTKESHPQARVVLHPIVDGGSDDSYNAGSDDEQASPADQREAQRMVALLRQARQDDPDGSIAVLVRAKAHLQPLVAELRQAGPELAYQAVEIEPLDQRQVIQDLLALTRALHHRADRVNWLAILRAPWCGLVLADLHTLAADDHRSTIWQLMQDDARWQHLSADGQQRLGHVRAVLSEAYRHQGQHRPRRWVEGVWQALGGPRCLQDASEAEDVTAFFTLLDSAEHKGSLDLDRLDEAMAKLFAAPDPKGGAIQLMTVHKSKGLEFDTVLLPGLHRTLRGNDRSLLLWEEVLLDDDEGDRDGSLNEALIVAPLPRRKPAKGAPPSAYDYLQEFEKRRSEHEGQRVLYVAVTRARRQLHLLAKVKPSDKEGEVCKAPAKNTALAQLWPALGAQFEAAVVQAAADTASPTEPATPLASPAPPPFIPWLQRLNTPAIHADLTVPDGAVKADAGNDELVELAEDHSLEADVGTLVHRYLDRMAQENLADWHAQRVAALAPRLSHWLIARGHTAEASRVGATHVVANLQTTLASTEGRWLLSAREDAGSEVPLTAIVEEDGRRNLRANVIDRTFVDRGVRWVVDYKTSRHEGDDLTATLQAEAERHRPQLERYARLMSGDGIPDGRPGAPPIALAIFFTAHGQLVRLN